MCSVIFEGSYKIYCETKLLKKLPKTNGCLIDGGSQRMSKNIFHLCPTKFSLRNTKLSSSIIFIRVLLKEFGLYFSLQMNLQLFL